MVAVTEEKPGDSRTDAPDSIGKDELNLSILPFAVASTQQPRHRDGTKHYKRVIKSQRWNDKLQTFTPTRITFKTNIDDGLPTTVDEQFFVGLFDLLYENNQFNDDELTCTPPQLFSLMNLKGRGDDYERLGDALLRLNAVRIVYEDTWWDGDSKEYLDTLALGIISAFRYRRPKDQADGRAKSATLWVRFDKELMTRIRAGVIKNLNLKLYFGFKRPLAKRMYRVLDRHFYNDPVCEMDLRIFACGQLGLPDTYDNGELKRKLAPAIKDLEDAGIIVAVPAKQRYQKIKAGIWRIRFERETNPGAQEVMQELLDRGVTEGVARNLIAQHTPDYIRPKVDLLDWKMRNNDSGVSKNPAGFLVKAIRDDYQPPKDFKNREQLAAVEASKQRRAAAKRRRHRPEQTEEDGQDQENAKLREQHEAAWLALTDDQRATYDLVTAKRMGGQSDKAVAYWQGVFRRRPDLMLIERLQAFADAKQDDPPA